VRAHIHSEQLADDRWHIRVEGSCTFLLLPRLTQELASVPAGALVTVDLSVDFLDHATHEAIEHWREQHEKTGGVVRIHESGSVGLDSALQGPPERALHTAR